MKEKESKLNLDFSIINKARESLGGSTLYINLEPCFHWGRTPPCVDKIISSGIRRVVIATPDPNPEVKGKSCNPKIGDSCC